MPSAILPMILQGRQSTNWLGSFLGPHSRLVGAALAFRFDVLDPSIQFLFEGRGLRLKELKTMVLELRMIVLAGMRERSLKCSV